MADLKAAANMMLDAAAATAEEMKVFRSGEWHDQAERERAGFLLAAQALEAWAWVAEKDTTLQPVGLDFDWQLEVNGSEYVADTPMGAVLAAMEGEKDGEA